MKSAQYKPHLLLQAFLEEFNRINASAFETHWSKNTRLEIVAFIADAPCRAQFLQVVQFNGNHPCHRCHIARENNLIPIMKHNNLILKSTELVTGYAKQTEELVRNPQLNLRGNPKKVDPVYGVKALSLLNSFNFDFIKRTPVEIMHCLFLGFVKRYLKLHVIDKLGAVDKERIDKRILSLKPPSCSKRAI